ncbi:MAG: protocatechuate 3,4-dioxygenase [Hyphomicrobiales bacterium]
MTRPALAALVATPAQTAGPFYPIHKPQDTDLDLTTIAGRPGRAQGDIIELTGRVLFADGTPAGDVLVELWQANAFGRYVHPRDDPKAASDPNFQGFGAVHTDAQGGFRFRTVKPANYRRRASHIHFRIADAGSELVTQMYFPGERLNARDSLYRRLRSDASREAATARQVDAARYVWDIVLG